MFSLISSSNSGGKGSRTSFQKCRASSTVLTMYLGVIWGNRFDGEDSFDIGTGEGSVSMPCPKRLFHRISALLIP